MIVHPVSDLLLVGALPERQQTTAQGLTVGKAALFFGKVIETGEGGMLPNGQRNPHTVEAGDTVMWTIKALGIPVNEHRVGSEQPRFLMHRGDIIARVEMEPQDSLVVAPASALKIAG